MTCKECGQEFKSSGGLHRHIKAKHEMLIAYYYANHYPRFNKYTGNPIPYKNFKQYFEEDFTNKAQFIKWCHESPIEEAREYVLGQIKKRIEEKDLPYLPTVNELDTVKNLPDIFTINHLFSNYHEVEKLLGASLRLSTKGNLPSLGDFSDMEIMIDTREQKPLKFEKSRIVKLECGDYTAAGKYYSKTFVERKSSSDFKGTMSQGFERFCKEMERAQDLKSFVYIVVDSDIKKMEKENVFGPHRAKMPFIYSRMREIQQKYDNCQFVFSGSRTESKELIPKLLYYGPEAWNLDIQYFINKRKRK